MGSDRQCPLVLAAEQGHLDAVGVILQSEWRSTTTSSTRTIAGDSGGGSGTLTGRGKELSRPTRNEALQQALVVGAGQGHRHVCDFLLKIRSAAGEGFDVNNQDTLRGETGQWIWDVS